MAIDFSPYHAVLLDLDGTIYRETEPLPGAIDLVRRLQREGRAFACLSNSASSPLSVMARLEEMGLEVDPNNIYTAAAAACDYVLERFPSAHRSEEAVVDRVWGENELHASPGNADAVSAEGVVASGSESTGVANSVRPSAPPAKRKPRLFNLATESVDDMLHGLVDWVQQSNDPCDAIVIGPPSSRFATDERQRTALELARKGAAIVGLCADRVYPSPRGIEFGSGALTWMLAYAANVEPTFCGKPEKIFFNELCQRLEVEPEWCLLIGDSLESDVYGGKGAGMRTILTLSGITRREELEAVAQDMRPDLVVEDLRELL